MAASEGGLRLHHLGYPGKAIIPTNYSAKVMEGYERIVNDIQSDKPAGCLSIISGPPGTGKTYFVRSVIEATDADSLFIMIPPDVVASMSGPQMIPLLMRIKEEYLETKSNVVFVVEDGDTILIPRSIDNQSHISTLLNITDGILGSLFSMRVLVTTNANALDFDEALTRPGRLSCRLQIGALSHTEAIIAYDAITKTHDGCKLVKGEMTLAEVYALANGNDYTFEDEDKGRVGF
jgi:ATP-dependent 26S proteasome regulatory subunit